MLKITQNKKNYIKKLNKLVRKNISTITTSQHNNKKGENKN